MEENILRTEKKRKLQALRDLGIDPYPHTYRRTHSISELRINFDHIQTGENTKELGTIHVAGRLMARRLMGKASFFNIQDQTGLLQVYVKSAELGDSKLAQVFDLLDIGDIVGVSGYMFRTKTGELSLHCESFQILCKSIEPLPEKFHGLSDIEIKYRHRHLDLIMDIESRKVFETRSKIIREVRRFFDDRGFLEVETPILQPLYGGAAARPFVTHHNALDMKLYMKISPELYLKRLIVGGLEKVYDINKNFRNEGIDRSHNPEFTMIEWYEAYTDYHDQMKQFEDLCSHLATVITGGTKVLYQGREIDFTPPWPRLSIYEGVKKYSGLSPESASTEEVFSELKRRGSPREKIGTKGEMVAELFELVAEEHLWQPTFVTDHPIEISPLTKKHREVPGLVERFEPFAACMEIGNAFTELNDPIEQRNRLEAQEKVRTETNEMHPMDEDFVHAIEVGMPPTGGVGLGLERIIMILTDRPSIRDIILFPTMKPQPQKPRG